MKRLLVVSTWLGILLTLAYLGFGRVRGEDADGDDLDDRDEIESYDTNPGREDTDDDGLSDGEEVDKYETDPNARDTDRDGLEDGEEVDKYETDPNAEDTDGDGYKDGEEVDEGSDPNDPTSVPRD